MLDLVDAAGRSVARPAYKVAEQVAHVARRFLPTGDPDERDGRVFWLGLRAAPVLERYYRSEVRGLRNVPATGPALIVSMHSGGPYMPDGYLFMHAFAKRFGLDRPLHVLVHDWIMVPLGLPGLSLLRKCGLMAANPENARAVLDAGSAVLLFPGGDYDLWRPFQKRHVVDWGGRGGFLRTAYEADVPLIPVVHVGSHEVALVLSRGEWLGRLLRTDRPPFRFKSVPIFVPAAPLPAKIVIQALPAIDLRERYPAAEGEEPDYDRMYADVMTMMQAALDQLAAERRLPILG